MGCGCIGELIPRVLTLAALGLLVGAAHSWQHPVALRLVEPTANGGLKGGPAPAPGSESPPKSVAPKPDALLDLHLTLEQTKGMWDRGVPFIDARLAKDFGPGHIAGAKNINPVNFSDPESVQAMQFMDTAGPVVVYCGGGDCHDSENTVILLQQAGFTALHIFTDGFPAWQAAGFEVEPPNASSPGGASTGGGR